jgi:hypothetical protein
MATAPLTAQISRRSSVVGELARNKFAFLVSLDSEMNRFES